MNDIFELFSRFLEERLLSGAFTTEDSVRYTFFYALINCNFCQPFEIILEQPHPTIQNAKVDLFIQTKGERSATAVEFKYDRPIPSEKNVPKTQKAGSVIKDLFRLARVPNEFASRRYFIYLNTPEMATYFRNPQNHMDSFFELPEGRTLLIDPNYISGNAATFGKVLGTMPIDCKVSNVLHRDLSQKHFLRIYQIHDADRK